ncbi:MAG: hypothetical protein POH28_06485 [Acidocella sp.]|nr:hypothetical protein [Acidocella sp.]
MGFQKPGTGIAKVFCAAFFQKSGCLLGCVTVFADWYKQVICDFAGDDIRSQCHAWAGGITTGGWNFCYLPAARLYLRPIALYEGKGWVEMSR